MYSDEDGTATKQSQAVYEARIKTLLLATCVLSFTGFCNAIWIGEYTKDKLTTLPSLDLQDITKYGQWLWPLVFLHSLNNSWSNANPIKLYSAGIRGSLISLLIVICSISAIKSNFNVLHSEKAKPSLVQILAAFSLTYIQLSYPRRPDVFTPDGDLLDREKTVSAISRYSMNWCTYALRIASKPITIRDFPALDYATRSKSQSSLLPTSSGTILWNRIIISRFTILAKQWIYMFVRALAGLAPPYCTMKLLKSIEKSENSKADAWMWVFCFAITSVVSKVVSQQLIFIQWSELAIPLRSQLIMTLFRKAMLKKDSKDPNETQNSTKKTEKIEAINLVASDTLSIQHFAAVNHVLPFSVVKFLLALIFLNRLLGWQSTLAGLATTAVCLPLHSFLINQQRAMKKKLTAVRDKRTSAITEALHALRQIKFSALEVQWDEYLESLRADEINQMRIKSIADNMNSIWKVAAPMIVSAASIWTYSYCQGSLAPSIVFPMVEVLPMLHETLGFLPFVLLDYFNARNNSHRIDLELNKPEQGNILRPSPSGRVSFHDASIQWPSDGIGEDAPSEKSKHRFAIHGINLDFPPNELSIISGKTGAGKSLVLAAIIGEVDLLSGKITAPSMADGHPVAYVSQSPWLQNGSIKHNILFGKELHEDRYQKVLTACALRPDLAALREGDDTFIGLRGVKLSGGQKARLAFARALYSTAKLMVLDDIFSALDSHVASEIFDALTGELGEGRTRILVTHHVSLCLPKAKYCVVVGNNSIEYAGEPNETAGWVKAVGIGSSKPISMNSTLTSNHDASKKVTRKIPATKKQKQPSARTSTKVYKTYFAAAGGIEFVLIYLSGLIIKRLLAALQTWLIGRINSTSRVAVPKLFFFLQSSSNGSQEYLRLYLEASLLGVLLETLFNFHTSAGSLRASKILLRAATFRVLRMPLIWLDTTPIGEMLRRFTVDSRMMDDTVLSTLSGFAGFVVRFIIVVFVGLYTSKYTSVLTILLLGWCAQVSRGYIKARSTVKQADKGPTADILEHFSSAAAGVSTIRAFGVVNESIDQMHKHLDDLAVARRHFWMFNRWIGLQLSLIGILFSTGTGAIILLSRSVVDASFLGFSLTFSSGFSQALFDMVNGFGILESCMGSVESIIEYTEMEPERQSGIELPENWPSIGKVEVKDLELAYSPSLPLVLKSISFTVEGSSRIGIVGRTGAGKSSLTLALLRLIEPQSGSILIDNIDITTVKLNDLRSRIAFIPQDPVLFSGTVRSNLDYFKQVSKKDLTAALRRVNLLAEDGDEKSGLFTLDSPISASGSNMSQGQRQLLCLARVLIKKPKILILDEATSAVDNKTDLLIQDTLRTEFHGTLIVVAHRLRTIAGFDQVMVMGDGQVLEIGKPEELLRKRGMFHDLVEKSQDRELLMNAIPE